MLCRRAQILYRNKREQASALFNAIQDITAASRDTSKLWCMAERRASTTRNTATGASVAEVTLPTDHRYTIRIQLRNGKHGLRATHLKVQRAG